MAIGPLRAARWLRIQPKPAESGAPGPEAADARGGPGCRPGQLPTRSRIRGWVSYMRAATTIPEAAVRAATTAVAARMP